MIFFGYFKLDQYSFFVFISRVLAPINKGPEKLSSYESGIEPMGDALISNPLLYVCSRLFLMLKHLYPWAMSFDVLGVSVCIYRSFDFRTYLNCWFSLCMAKRGIGMVLAPEYSDNQRKK